MEAAQNLNSETPIAARPLAPIAHDTTVGRFQFTNSTPAILFRETWNGDNNIVLKIIKLIGLTFVSPIMLAGDLTLHCIRLVIRTIRDEVRVAFSTIADEAVNAAVNQALGGSVQQVLIGETADNTQGVFDRLDESIAKIEPLLTKAVKSTTEQAAASTAQVGRNVMSASAAPVGALAAAAIAIRFLANRE